MLESVWEATLPVELAHFIILTVDRDIPEMIQTGLVGEECIAVSMQL